MKKSLILILFAGITLFSACSQSGAAPSPASSGALPAVVIPDSVADGSENDPIARAESYALPLIQAALDTLSASKRDDLSTVTFPFDTEYAYSGPTREQAELYGSSDDGEYAESDSAYFDAVCNLVVENMPQDASAYDKYRYLAYFLSEATDYDEKVAGGIMCITPYGAIVEGSSICLGYATAYLYLCQKADLWCTCVYGYSQSGFHGWNLVKLEDGTYYVDVTWSDSLGDIGSTDWQSYFMLTEDVLLQDHGIWSGGPATGKILYG